MSSAPGLELTLSDCAFRRLNINAQAALSPSDLQTYFSDGVDKTWPIVAMSYMFVLKDLTSIGETGVHCPFPG